MITTAWCLLAVLGVASAEEERTSDPMTPPIPRVRRDFAGGFERAPVPHWNVRLPGPTIAAASHTERTRPVAEGSEVYVGSAAARALYALDRRNGTVLRTYEASASVESEPLVAGDRVYFTDTGGRTSCFLRDGTPVWTHESGAPVLVRPTLHQGRLYVTNVEDLVFSLDAETGALLWRYEHERPVSRRVELALYAAPPAVIAGSDVLVGFSDGELVALDAVGGDRRWSVGVGQGRYPDLIAEPVYLDGMVYASGYFQPFVAIEPASRHIVWELEIGAAAAPVVVQRPNGAEPLILHPATDGVLRGIMPRTGDEVWSWDSKDDGALTSPVVTPAGILVGSSNGTVSLIDGDTGKASWSFRPPFVLEGISAPPSVDGRQLFFVTNAGNLYSMLSPEADEPRR